MLFWQISLLVLLILMMTAGAHFSRGVWKLNFMASFCTIGSFEQLRETAKEDKSNPVNLIFSVQNLINSHSHFILS